MCAKLDVHHNTTAYVALAFSWRSGVNGNAWNSSLEGDVYLALSDNAADFCTIAETECFVFLNTNQVS